MMVTVAFALAAGLGALAGMAVAPLTQTAFDVGAAIGSRASRPRSSAGSATPSPPWPAASCSACSRASRSGSSPRLQGRRRPGRPARRAVRRAPGTVRPGAAAGQGGRDAPEPGQGARAPRAGAVALVVPLVVTDRYLLKVFTFVGINALVVVGMALLFGYAGQVSLGHAAFVGLGAYTCAFCTVELGWPWLRRLRGRRRRRGASAACCSPFPACGSRATTWRWPRSASGSSCRWRSSRPSPSRAAWTGSPASRSRPSAPWSSARPRPCTGWCGVRVGIAVLVAPTSPRCAPDGRCAPCTAASWARRPAAWTW